MSIVGLTWNDDFFLDLKDELNEVSPSETSLIRITNRLINMVTADIDLPTAIRLANIYYCGADYIKYAEPAGMKSQALIDLRPRDSIVDRPIRLVSPYRFAQYNAGEYATVQMEQNKEWLEIIHDQTSAQQTFITSCNTSATADGAWTAGTGASNVTWDSYTFKKGSGAINFDVSGTTATISFARTSVIDISGYTSDQRVRFFMKLPTAPTSIAIRWGSSSSNYYSHTITTQTSGESFSTSDWNELEASRSSATETGTVDMENVNYFALVLTFSGATTDTDFLIDYIMAIKPEPLTLEYYTYYSARTATGTYSEALTVSASTTDLLEFPEEWRQCLINGVCWMYLKMRGDKTAKQDALMYRQFYEESKYKLRSKYPSRRSRYQRRRLLPRLSI